MKPYFERGRLTREAPRRTGVPMEDSDKDRKPAAESREAKLALALRANLRRRKAAGPAPPAPKSRKTSSD